MGIQGLLTFVKPASKSVHLSDLKGQTVAIDSYCWIHKGAFGCAEKLGKGEDTDAYVQYCFKFIDMLRSFKITPIMVFDGQNLPAKRLTEEKRREVRAIARKKAAECLKLNKHGEARMNFIKAVDVTPEMALKLIKACRKKNIDCIVAPYEADAQLAFLSQSGIVDCIITEDSDLLVFGCNKVLFKLDLNGNGTLVESNQLFLTMDEKPESFTLDKFRHMCILSGCDYIDSLPGVGLKKGMKFIKANSNGDIYDILPKLPTSLNLKNVVVSKEYRDSFMTADATFKHQLIFDPLTRKIKPLMDLEICGTNPDFCSNAGDMMDHKIAFQLAIGNLSPDNLEVLDNWNPDKELSPYAFKPSIWSKSYKKPEKSKIVPKTNHILPTTKNQNVILEIRIPLIPIEEQLKTESYIKKEIESLYFEEPPAKKICLETPKKEPKKSISPTLNRRNVFIKSRFFAEKTEQNKSPVKNLTSPKSPISEDNPPLDEFPIKGQLSDKSPVKGELSCKSPIKVAEEPLNELNPGSPINQDNSIIINDDSNSNEVLSGSQKENCETQNKVFRSRFFSADTTEEVISQNDTANFNKTFNTVSSSNFKRSISLDEKLIKIEQKSTIVTRSTTCRRPGLSRKNSGSKFTVQKNQTKLSMFFKTT